MKSNKLLIMIIGIVSIIVAIVLVVAIIILEKREPENHFFTNKYK